MEASYYNVVAPCGDGAVVYNTRRRTLAELSADDVNVLEHVDAACSEGNPVVEQLISAGFLVKSAEAEADELLYRQHQYRNGRRVFELTITPSRQCNFDCDYCYVPKRPGVMSEETQDAVVAFVVDHYERMPFKELRLNWYGGEPMMSIDIMERMSAPIMRFCEEKGVRFIGHMLSNASLADEQMSKRLKENCGIVSVMPSISGFGDMHDWQRPAKNGKKYFDVIMHNIDCMLDAGITVHVNYVTNHNNIEECTELAKQLCHKRGVITRLSKTGAFGKERIVLRDGKSTPVQLFSPEEFGPAYVEFYRAQGLDAAGYRELLKPIPLYCAALVDQSFFIDEVGDVTCCMVDMDYPERAVFNINDWARGSVSPNLSRVLAYGNLEPIRDLECRRCRVLPLCQGGCYEKYLASGTLACHNIKYCIEQVVLDFHEALEREGCL